jgi:WXG100 family type VII secretion target
MAASGQVSVDHPAFLKAQRQYADVIPAIRSIANNLDSSVHAAEGAWQGQAYTAFVSFAGQLDQAITALNQQLQATAEALYHGNTVLGSQDENNTTSFTSLGNSFNF